MLKHSPNKINAIKFLEFLVSEEAQTHLSKNSFEYPIVENIKIPKTLKLISQGFKEDKLTPVEIYGKLQTKSFNLMLEKSGIKLFKTIYYSKENLFIFLLVLAISTIAITLLFSIVLSLLKGFF